MSETRTCAHCPATFTVRYPSNPKRFCSLECGIKGRVLPPRTDAGNSNWRGGKSKHELYDVYNDMVGRCTRPTHQRWASYGGRGIDVCARWREDFWAFVADMGERPPGYSIDRIDNDGNYEPSNCRWADGSTQARNRRDLAYAGSRRDPVTGTFLPKGAVA